MDKDIAKVLEDLGVRTDGGQDAPAVYMDLPPAALAEHALRRGEGEFLDNGAFAVATGERTGRSPKDRFIVDDDRIHDDISWGGVNVPIDPEVARSVRTAVAAHLVGRELFVVRGFAGA